MPALETTSRLLERLGDFANPILVKETRQAFKSRQFVMTFMLLLFAAWAISTFGMLLAGDLMQYEAVGPGFFFAYYMVLSIAIFVVVPLGAHRSMLAERDEKTLELLTITGLSPRKIVWGKLLSALVQQFLYYSAIAPFIAFTSLLDGFDFLRVAFLLVLSGLISLAISMLAIMVSTVTKQKQWQALSSFGLLGLLIWGLSSLYVLAGTVLAGQIPLDDLDFWKGFAVAFIAAASYFVLIQQITVAQLTFESDNRSTAIRVTCSIQFLLLILWTGWAVPDPDVQSGLLMLALAHLGICSLFFCTEDETLSRRIRRRLPKRRLLRLLMAPYLPGGYRGLCYLLVHLIACWLAAWNLGTWTGSGSGSPAELDDLLYGLLVGHDTVGTPDFRVLTALMLYMVILLGLSLWLGRLAQRVSHDVKPAHLRMITLLLVAAGTIGPYLPMLLVARPTAVNPLWYVTNPFQTLSTLGSRTNEWSATLLSMLFYAAAFVVAVNLAAIRRGLRDAVSGPLSASAAVPAEDVAASRSTAQSEGSPA